MAKPVVVRLQGFQHDLEQETANCKRDQMNRQLEQRRTIGSRSIFSRTGIKVTDWRGKIWIRWSDAVRDAGLKPNQLNQAYHEVELI